jgi:dimeric dUTPase (all-alpha-NTP-PPase superfamily)
MGGINVAMTLEKMYEMQKSLDACIIREKGLEGVDLLPNTVLALQVEIAELANEWRGFKFWSNKQEPRTKEPIECFPCMGTGTLVRSDYTDEKCPNCNGAGVKGYKNPLLEEFVDCLHFFLSIARQLDLPADDLYVWDDVIEGETTILFTELLHNVGLILADRFLANKIKDVQAYRRDHLRAALFIFYGLGLRRLGLTWDQIAEAYVEKNKVNHERQANGY